MRLIKFEVREDWQEFSQQSRAQSEKLWRSAQLVVLLSIAASTLNSFLKLNGFWQVVVHSAFSGALFIGFALWQVYRSRRDAIPLLALTGLGLTGAVLLAGRSAPAALPAAAASGAFSWQSGLGLLAPVVVWSFLVWVLRRFPTQMKSQGLWMDRWLTSLILGVAAGGSLGLHFLLATYLLPQGNLPPAVDAARWTWFVGYLIALAAPGEELLLRGIAFTSLYENARYGYWRIAGQIAFLNLMIYIVPVFQTNADAPFWVFWILFYRLVYSFMVTFLRFRQGSLLLCIICNVTFNALIAIFHPW